MGNNNYIFGIRAAIEAIRSDKTIDKMLIQKGLQGEVIKELSELIKQYDIPHQLVPVQKLNRITRKNHQGVIAFISPIPFYDIDEIIARTYEQGKSPLFLFLDHITDVRNFGAIVRTAECAGVQAIIVPEKGAAQINADAVKTSAGALHLLPVCKVKNTAKTIENLQSNGMKIIAATEKAADLYTTPDYTSPCVVVMGSEESGISDDILKKCDHMIKIPVCGKIESLNVSVATGIVLYEALKQRS